MIYEIEINIEQKVFHFFFSEGRCWFFCFLFVLSLFYLRTSDSYEFKKLMNSPIFLYGSLFFFFPGHFFGGNKIKKCLNQSKWEKRQN